MATNFPTNLDTYTDKTSADVITSAGWNNMQDAIEAVEAKVGADSSAETTSHDYILTNASSSNPGHTHTTAEGATDLTATASEINTVCDGDTAKNNHAHTLATGASDVTATYAEINSVCDGNSASAAEIASVCDGCTATAAEINTACDGTTARNSHVHTNISVSGGSAITVSRADLGGALSISVTALSVGSEHMQTGTDERDWVLARCAAAAVGAVGTYAFLSYSGLTISPGDTVSGASCSYAGMLDGATSIYTSGTPSGTWRCMGYNTNLSGTKATLYMRTV